MITLPPPVAGRSLVGIFKITRLSSSDEVRLGEFLIGTIDTKVVSPTITEYSFKPVNQTVPYPRRNSYTECWFDILTMIANDQDLAIEFTIRVNRNLTNNFKMPNDKGVVGNEN